MYIKGIECRNRASRRKPGGGTTGGEAAAVGEVRGGEDDGLCGGCKTMWRGTGASCTGAWSRRCPGGSTTAGEAAAVGEVRGGDHTGKHGTLPDGTIHGNTELIREEEGGGITLLWRRRRIEGIGPMRRLGNRCLLPRWTAGWL